LGSSDEVLILQAFFGYTIDIFLSPFDNDRGKKTSVNIHLFFA